MKRMIVQEEGLGKLWCHRMCVLIHMITMDLEYFIVLINQFASPVFVSLDYKDIFALSGNVW